MHVETKFLRLFRAVELGDDIDGWRVCWLGGWDKCRVLFVVMVKRLTELPGAEPPCRRSQSWKWRHSPRYARCSTNATRRTGGVSLEDRRQPVEQSPTAAPKKASDGGILAPINQPQETP